MKILSDNRTIDELIESLEIRQQKKKNDGKFEENKFQEVIQVLKKLNVGTSFDLSSQSSISVLDATERKALAYGTTVQGLDVVEGVIVTETSTGKTFTLITPDPTLDASWVEISNTGTVTFPDLIIQGQSQINYDNIVNAPITPQVSLTVNAESRTTANLVATYDNGTAGVGATLTMNSVGAFASQDGINIITSSTKYLLVVNQTDAKQNGLYLLTTDGDGSTQAVLTRAVEFDEISEVNNYSVKVNAGTLYASKQYYVLTNINTIGTDNINFAEVSAASVSQATESVAGIAELATQAETNTGTDDLRIVTPLKLKNASFLSSSINLGTIRFVSKNGNDSTALVGRIDKPYLTLAAAFAASVTGDVIWCINLSIPTGTLNIGSTGFRGYIFDNCTFTGSITFANQTARVYLSNNTTSVGLLHSGSGSLDINGDGTATITGVVTANRLTNIKTLTATGLVGALNVKYISDIQEINGTVPLAYNVVNCLIENIGKINCTGNLIGGFNPVSTFSINNCNDITCARVVETVAHTVTMKNCTVSSSSTTPFISGNIRLYNCLFKLPSVSLSTSPANVVLHDTFVEVTGSATSQRTLNQRNFGSLTDAERLTISPVAGDRLYNITLGVEMYYNGTTWVSGNENDSIIQTSGVYSAPTARQLLLPFLTYKGYDFPYVIFRVGQDTWIETPAPVVQTSFSGITPTELRINWNVPMHIDYTGATVPAPVYTYYYELATDALFSNIVASGTTASNNVLITGLTVSTTHYARILHGQKEIGQIAYSNVISGATLSLTTVFGGLQVINPLYLYDFEPVLTGDTTVTNQGSVGGTATKSGTFTKDGNYLRGGTSASITQTLTSTNLGQTGDDWVMLMKCKVPSGIASSNRIYFTLDLSSAPANERIRFINQSTASGNIRFTGDDLAGGSPTINISPAATASLDEEFVIMAICKAGVINFYKNGSGTPVSTLTLPGGTVLGCNRVRVFGGSADGVNSIDACVEYCAFHTVADITSLEAGFINLMTLTI